MFYTKCLNWLQSCLNIIEKNYFLQINSISCITKLSHIELNLYKSLTPCAMCHQLSLTDIMINTRIGKICIKCDIQMTKARKKVKISKTTKAPKKLLKQLS
jgi:hypothetical protein